MIKKTAKHINNPLTLIAIFAGIVEIVSTFAIKIVDSSLQYVFAWFVIGFPVILTLLFFLTLIFKPRVLYSPSDFKDEKNFLIMNGLRIEQPKSQARNSKKDSQENSFEA